MPEPDETLDAPVYEPPRRRKVTAVGVMLVTIAVVALVIAIVIGVVFPRFVRHHLCMKTKDFVCRLHLACENYRDLNGQYPWAKAEEVTATTEINGKDVYARLRTPMGASDPSQDYLGEVYEKHLKDGTMMDNWGHEILFRVDPKTGKAVIWSCGLNGIDETNDGESPDPAKFPKGYYWFGKGDTGDDIVSR